MGRIIENSDNRGSDNGGYTVLQMYTKYEDIISFSKIFLHMLSSFGELLEIILLSLSPPPVTCQ